MLTVQEINQLFRLQGRIPGYATQRARVACLSLLGEELASVLKSHEEFRQLVLAQQKEALVAMKRIDDLVLENEALKTAAKTKEAEPAKEAK